MVVKILLHERENLVPITNVRSLVWGHVLALPALARLRQEDRRDSLASRSSRVSECKTAVRDHVLESSVESWIISEDEQHLRLSCGLCMHANICAHTHSHTHVCVVKHACTYVLMHTHTHRVAP